MEAIEGQTSFYTATAQEKLDNIETARKKWVKARIAIADNLRARKELTKLASQAHTEFLVASGGDSLQREIELSWDAQRTLDLQGTSLETSAILAEARRKRIEGQVLLILSACGGIMTNQDLAMGLNPPQDAHGLAGLLSKFPRVERFHDGRLGNELMSWKLLPE